MKNLVNNSYDRSSLHAYLPPPSPVLVLYIYTILQFIIIIIIIIIIIYFSYILKHNLFSISLNKTMVHTSTCNTMLSIQSNTHQSTVNERGWDCSDDPFFDD